MSRPTDWTNDRRAFERDPMLQYAGDRTDAAVILTNVSGYMRERCDSLAKLFRERPADEVRAKYLPHWIQWSRMAGAVDALVFTKEGDIARRLEVYADHADAAVNNAAAPDAEPWRNAEVLEALATLATYAREAATSMLNIPMSVVFPHAAKPVAEDKPRKKPRRKRGEADALVAAYIKKQGDRHDITLTEVATATNLAPSTIIRRPAWLEQKKKQKALDEQNARTLRENAKLADFR